MFDNLVAQYSPNTQTILKHLDVALKGFGSVQRYTTDVPDVRYRLEFETGFKPVFARVRPGPDEVLVEIEPVLDPLHRTRPREKSAKWRPKSPRSDTELPLKKTPDCRGNVKSGLSSRQKSDLRKRKWKVPMQGTHARTTSMSSVEREDVAVRRLFEQARLARTESGTHLLALRAQRRLLLQKPE